MNAKLKELYKVINQKFPVIGSLARRIYYQKPFDTVTKKINGKNNVINYEGSILSSVKFDIIGNGNSINIQSSCVLNAVTFYILGDNHVIDIGEGSRFIRGGNIWFEDSGGSLIIGDKCSFEDAHLAVTEPGSSIKIGHDCMFAYDIDVRTGDSHSIIDANSQERINYAKDVSIGDHVWIAAHCTILKGVHIPDESVVATGSIVTKPFSQKGVIIAGNPARVVKEGITWSRKRVYKTIDFPGISRRIG